MALSADIAFPGGISGWARFRSRLSVEKEFF